MPKPGRETAPGFSLRGGGAPQKRLGFLGPQMPGDPKRKRFLAAASPHPKPQNQQRNEENAPISQRPKRKSGRPAAGLTQPRDEHGAEPARGCGGKHCQACRPAGRGRQRGRHPHLQNRLSPVGQHNPVAFELPSIHSTQDCLRATSAILTGIASGDVAPSAAMQIARVIDVHLRAISTNDLEARMTKLEKDRANSAAQGVAGGEIFR